MKKMTMFLKAKAKRYGFASMYMRLIEIQPSTKLEVEGKCQL